MRDKLPPSGDENHPGGLTESDDQPITQLINGACAPLELRKKKPDSGESSALSKQMDCTESGHWMSRKMGTAAIIMARSYIRSFTQRRANAQLGLFFVKGWDNNETLIHSGPGFHLMPADSPRSGFHPLTPMTR